LPVRGDVRDTFILGVFNAVDAGLWPTGVTRGDLVALAHAINAYQQTRLGEAMLRGALGNAPDANLKAFWDTRPAATSAALERAAARGDLSSDFNPRLVLETLVGLLFMRNFLTMEGTDDEMVDQAVDLILSGISSRS